MVPAFVTLTFGFDPGAMLFPIVMLILLVAGGWWADRVDRENPR